MDPVFSAPAGVGGSFRPPADKSITHRALMLAAVSEGQCRVKNPLQTGDCVSTRRCLEALGAVFTAEADALLVRGVGLRGFTEPSRVLDAENSGTTMRLMSGLLAGQRLMAVITGDSSLTRRPMGRVVEPLRRMGALIEGRSGGTLAPLCFLPGSGRLSAAALDLPVASAQVKSALLLAALRGEGESTLRGPAGRSRDHTERMLRSLGVAVEDRGGLIRVQPAASLPGFDVEVPGDVSSASFFIAAALICGRRLEVTGCGVNPTRLGFLAAVRRMGAAVEVTEERTSLGEPIGVIRVSPAALCATDVSPQEVPDLIDELPLVAVLGLFARGRTVVRGAAELRHKESDRLVMIQRMAESLGGRIDLHEDGFTVEGPQALRPGTVDPAGDHRIAMAAAVAGAGIRGGVEVARFEAARVSYPDFLADFQRLGGVVG
jgi:3-phosphoshikimate 1-carboxyvinyltransferase